MALAEEPLAPPLPLSPAPRAMGASARQARPVGSKANRSLPDTSSLARRHAAARTRVGAGRRAAKAQEAEHGRAKVVLLRGFRRLAFCLQLGHAARAHERQSHSPPARTAAGGGAGLRAVRTLAAARRARPAAARGWHKRLSAGGAHLPNSHAAQRFAAPFLWLRRARRGAAVMDQTTEQRLTFKRRFTEFLDDDVRLNGARARAYRATAAPATRRGTRVAPSACRAARSRRAAVASHARRPAALTRALNTARPGRLRGPHQGDDGPQADAAAG